VRFAEQFVTTTEGGGAASGFQEASKSPVELGIQVLVIPHVTGNDNNVILTIVPKTEDFTDPSNPFVEFTGAGITLKLPQTSQRIVVTKMMLKNGETGVIAGLREERTGTTVSKIPFFGDIPILGWLFRHKSYSKDAKNLVIFVTPTIIDFARREELDERVKGIQEGLGRPFGVFEEESPAPAAAPAPAATETR
jgi:type II secretory pathway component GspD/PulD (secretin)